MPRDVTEIAVALWAPAAPPPDRTTQQKRVGAFVHHLNRRIAKHSVIVKPGAVRGSYQLYGLSTWEVEQAALRQALLPAAADAPLAERNPRAPEAAERAKAGEGRRRKRNR